MESKGGKRKEENGKNREGTRFHTGASSFPLPGLCKVLQCTKLTNLRSEPLGSMVFASMNFGMQENR